MRKKSKKSKKVKKVKKVKKKKLSTIRNRIFKLWSTTVLSRTDWTCEYCGIKKGDINRNGKIEKIDAHHLFSRNVKNAILKFDIRNGVAACPTCHKWGSNSFHRNPVVTMNWLLENSPSRFDFVLTHWMITIDLDNRKILEAIEEYLKEKKHLDIKALRDLELLYPRSKKKKKEKIKGNLFENLIDPTDLTDPINPIDPINE